MKTLEAVSPIAQLENQIEILNQEIAIHEAELAEFQSGVEILAHHPDWKPKENSTIFETLEALITNKSTATEREERLNNAKGAIAQQTKLIADKKAKVQTLETSLLAEKEEAEWLQKYAPFASRYEQGFPTPINPSIQQIASLRKDITELRSRLDEASKWMAAPQFSKPQCFYTKTPKQDFEYIPGAIAVREESIRKLQNQSPVPRDEIKFRKYIVSRTNIEDSLSKLLKAQEIYLDTIAEFKAIALGNESAIEFDLDSLAAPALVTVKDGKVILN